MDITGAFEAAVEKAKVEDNDVLADVTTWVSELVADLFGDPESGQLDATAMGETDIADLVAQMAVVSFIAGRDSVTMNMEMTPTVAQAFMEFLAGQAGY